MRTQWLGLFVLVCTASYAADITPLDVKPGEWEITATSQMSGMEGTIPPDTLAKMSPEQRAQMEAALKQMSKPRTSVARKCIKKEDLNKPVAWTDNRTNCKETVLSSSRNKLEYRLDCDENNGKSTGTLTVEAVNPETIKVDLRGNGTANGKTGFASFTGAGKWLGATCTGN